MFHSKRSPAGKSGETSRRNPMIFRFRRQPAVESGYVAPFTELYDEKKAWQYRVGQFFRRLFNGLLLFILAAALLALIAAFAYQLIYNPQKLAEYSMQLISSVEQFIASFTAVP